MCFEFAVSSSLVRDREEKPRLYAAMGVQEYFVFDVDKKAIPGLLEGFRRDPDRGHYLPIPSEQTGEGYARLRCETLGLDLAVVPEPLAEEGFALRAFLEDSLVPLPTREEARLAREKDAALAKKDAALAEKDAALVEKDAALVEKDAALRAAQGEIERLRQAFEERGSD